MTNLPTNPKPQFEDKTKTALPKLPKVNKAEVKRELLKIIRENKEIERKIKVTPVQNENIF